MAGASRVRSTADAMARIWRKIERPGIHALRNTLDQATNLLRGPIEDLEVHVASVKTRFWALVTECVP